MLKVLSKRKENKNQELEKNIVLMGSALSKNASELLRVTTNLNKKKK
ncbi:hypothetical protein [Paenibacillus sp. MY03]|nr:hypothetical protein [Paenibacillus sp. MY03]